MKKKCDNILISVIVIMILISIFQFLISYLNIDKDTINESVIIRYEIIKQFLVLNINLAITVIAHLKIRK